MMLVREDILLISVNGIFVDGFFVDGIFVEFIRRIIRR